MRSCARDEMMTDAFIDDYQTASQADELPNFGM